MQIIPILKSIGPLLLTICVYTLVVVHSEPLGSSIHDGKSSISVSRKPPLVVASVEQSSSVVPYHGLQTKSKAAKKEATQSLTNDTTKKASIPKFLRHYIHRGLNDNTKCSADEDWRSIPIGDIIAGEAAGDRSGFSVDLSGDGTIVAIGARYNDGGNGVPGNDDTRSGHVRVYKRGKENQTWIQLGQDINGKSSGALFGGSISLSHSGHMLAIGSVQGNGNKSGLVRVYYYSAANKSWTEFGDDIVPENETNATATLTDVRDFNRSWFGSSVSLSDDGLTVAVGASQAGTAHVYTYLGGGSWIRKGSVLKGKVKLDTFGHAISLSGDGLILAIGANSYLQVYEFSTSVGDWEELGLGQGDSTQYAFPRRDAGYANSISLSRDGSTLAASHFLASASGYYEVNKVYNVRVFRLVRSNASNDDNQLVNNNDNNGSSTSTSNTHWESLGGAIQGGKSVRLNQDGSIIAIGDRYHDEIAVNAGKVQLYQYKDEYKVWDPLGDALYSVVDENGNGHENGDVSDGSGDQFGYSVALSRDGHTVAAGARNSDANGIDSGHTRVFDVVCKLNGSNGGSDNNNAPGPGSRSWNFGTLSIGLAVLCLSVILIVRAVRKSIVRRNTGGGGKHRGLNTTDDRHDYGHDYGNGNGRSAGSGQVQFPLPSPTNTIADISTALDGIQVRSDPGAVGGSEGGRPTAENGNYC